MSHGFKHENASTALILENKMSGKGSRFLCVSEGLSDIVGKDI